MSRFLFNGSIDLARGAGSIGCLGSLEFRDGILRISMITGRGDEGLDPVIRLNDCDGHMAAVMGSDLTGAKVQVSVDGTSRLCVVQGWDPKARNWVAEQAG